MPILRYSILILLVISVCFSYTPVGSNKGQIIYEGVSVQGIKLGGKNITDVYHILEVENKKVGLRKIYLHLPDREGVKEVTFATLGIEVDKSKIWQEGFAQGRSGSWWAKLKVRWYLQRKGINLPLYLTINQEAAQRVLEEVGQPWYVAAKEARFIISDRDEVLIQKEEWGESVAIAEAICSLQKKLLLNLEADLHLYLSLEKIQPQIVKEELKGYGISSRLSSFTTWFNSTNVNRSKNIRLAVKELELIHLSPGDIFSFNETVGPRTKERGYDEADIIQNYSLVPGVGGGICQVSSTLYNAILLADLEVIERYPHSIIINYVQPGLDATVVYGSRDFRFKNNTTGHLLIKVRVEQGSVVCKVFGRPEKKKKVALKTYLEREIKPSTIYQEDPLVPSGNYIIEREGRPGRVVRVERHVYDLKGELIKKEVISRDIYPPIDMVIRSSTEPQSMSISEII